MTTDPKRILAVEDSATQAEALRALLERAGHHVTVATSGELALETFTAAAQPFDIVVSDIEMPGSIDGYELCRRIKAGARRRTPVVLLTSHSDPMDIIKGLESGADNFFTKPYEEQHLLERINRLLETMTARQRSAMRVGVQVTFLGREFTISSEREQILDLLISTFEDAVRQNRELRQREAEIEEARAALARYTGALETDIERFFDLANDLICVVGAEGYFERLNPAWTRLLGEPESGLMSEHIIARAHPDDRAEFAYELENLRRSDTGRATLVNRFRCRDGSYRWLEWRAIAVPGAPTVYAIARDVTERKEAEQELQARLQQQAAVTSLGEAALQATDISSLLDVATRLVAETLGVPLAKLSELSNDGSTLTVRAAHGWPSAEAGSEPIAVTGTHPAGATLLNNAPVVVADLRTERRFERPAEGMGRDVVSSVAVVVPVQGRPYGVLEADTTAPRSFSQNDVLFLQAVAHILGTAIDRSRSDLRLQASQRLESVGRLAGGIAHDFNNLLTVIQAHCDFLLSSSDTPHALKGEIQEITDATMRAASLTRQLLAFSRRQVLEPKVVRVNAIVEELDRMLRRLIGEDIRLNVELAPDIEPVLADRGQLEQVIMNLIVNARDAMLPRGGTIDVSTSVVDLADGMPGLVDQAPAGRYVMLCVRDTGAGMDRETLARIFEPFFTTKGPDRGTGLGLATVYGIVRQSRGTIAVTSELRRGTEFRIYLPVATDLPEPATASSARPEGGKQGNETILLVEDEVNVRMLTARVLRRLGYQVLEASNGDEALRMSAAHEGRIHLLVSDVLMPGIHGGALAQALRESRPDLRVLHVSGHTDPQIVDDGIFRSGASFLQKPFTAASLGQKVREVLDE